MVHWTEAQVEAYFESGGADVPACTADLSSLSMCQRLAPELADAATDYELDSARSSIDGHIQGGRRGTSEAPTVPYADLNSGDPLGEDLEMGAELIDDDINGASGASAVAPARP